MDMYSLLLAAETEFKTFDGFVTATVRYTCFNACKVTGVFTRPRNLKAKFVVILDGGLNL
jgi:hypothetical protein